MQALLRLLKHDPAVLAVLTSMEASTPRMTNTAPSPHVEQFPELRLLEGCSPEKVAELHVCLIRGLLEDPPYYLLWLRNHPLSKEIVEYVLNGSDLYEGY